MLELITGKKRLLAFPSSLHNAVVKWCTGLKSDTGTIRVKQSGQTASIDVNIPEVATRAAASLANRFPMIGDNDLLGDGLKWSNGRLCIDEEWVSGIIQRRKGR